jgi:septal ring factor EnvC (AmiA/AmiB activator)
MCPWKRRETENLHIITYFRNTLFLTCTDEESEMSRPRALTNAQVFELADSLLAEGIEATVVRLSERAKERYQVTPSYSTLKDSLAEWRRFGGAHRPKEISPQFLEIVLQAFKPLYKQLVEQVRAEHEPQLTAARETADAASDALLKSESERRRQEEEIVYLRNLVEKSAENERECGKQLTDLALARADAERANALLDAAQARILTFNRDLERAREAHASDLNAARGRIASLESQLSSLLTRRSELDQRYESLLGHLEKQEAAQLGAKP